MITADDIDARLPQTQCQQCQYPGCRPYATALAKGEAEIDRCPPGGVETLLALADLLNRDATPFLADRQTRSKTPQRAVIQEDQCIGCTKCLQVCPTDAILGSHKQMHTVIASACTGCELCLAPCPVDCITLVPTTYNNEQRQTLATQWRTRHAARQTRLARPQQRAEAQPSVTARLSADERKAAIAAAVARAQQRKQSNHE